MNIRFKARPALLEHPAKDDCDEDITSSSQRVNGDGKSFEFAEVGEECEADATDGVDHDSDEFSGNEGDDKSCQEVILLRHCDTYR